MLPGFTPGYMPGYNYGAYAMNPIMMDAMNQNMPRNLQVSTQLNGRDAELHLHESKVNGSMTGFAAGAASGAFAGAKMLAWAGVYGIAAGAIAGGIAGAFIGGKYAEGAYAEADVSDGDHQMNGSVPPWSVFGSHIA
jgi:outer membrane lipoprotein SlyB